MIIYLDESGDLGFDFTKTKTSLYFVITLLVVEQKTDADVIRRSVARTIRKKLHGRKGKKRLMTELKGAKTSFGVKRYFWNQICGAKFSLFAIILNKRRVNTALRKVPDRLYNYLARVVIDKLPLQSVTDLDVILDKSKSRLEIQDFNNYLSIYLKGKVDPRASLDIDHLLSHEEKGLQAVDMFAWGIFRKYERNDVDWFDLFKDRVAFADIYLP